MSPYMTGPSSPHSAVTKYRNVSATFVDSILTPKEVLRIAYYFMATKELPFIVFEKMAERKSSWVLELSLAGA